MQTHDLYLRTHTVVLDEPKKRKRRQEAPSGNLPKWPELALIFHCESRTDISQDLTVGSWRLMKLQGNTYVLEEEGIFFDDDLPKAERAILEKYAQTAVSDKKSFPPHFPLLSRSNFIK